MVLGQYDTLPLITIVPGAICATVLLVVFTIVPCILIEIFRILRQHRIILTHKRRAIVAASRRPWFRRKAAPSRCQ